MKLNAAVQKLTIAGLACGGFVMVSAALNKPAHAQLPEGDRASKLRALQSSVLTRPLADTVSPVAEPDAPDTTIAPSTTVPSTAAPSTEPLPETLDEAIATVTPLNNQLSISLMNTTGTTVTYEVLGDTSRRVLMAGESVMLQAISLPVTITTVREDNGFLSVAATSSVAGLFEISLSQRPDLDNDQSVIRIQADGQVFVN
ncbi:MAG: hypothetical protein WBA76_21595 [Phormidesmis sp.]